MWHVPRKGLFFVMKVLIHKKKNSCSKRILQPMCPMIVELSKSWDPNPSAQKNTASKYIHGIRPVKSDFHGNP